MFSSPVGVLFMLNVKLYMVSTRQAVVIGLLTRKSETNLQTIFDNPQLFSKNRTNFLRIFSI